MIKFSNIIKLGMLYLFLIAGLGLEQQVQANLKERTVESNELASKALEEAIADLESRLAKVESNLRMSYVKTKDDNDGTVRMYRFTPIGKDGGEWNAIDSPIADNNTEQKQWDNDALIMLDSFNMEKVALKSVTDDTWIFELPSLAEINVNSEQADEEKRKELSNLFHAELEVSKLNPRFISYRLYSTKPFSPEFSVKVAKFEQYNELREAWPNGPIVSIKQDEKIEGTIGFFIGLDEHSTIVNSDFTLVEVH